jgi:RsiW-degrading membrane proteinase PrsW (M82 family)
VNTFFQILFLSILPGLIWVIFIYRTDRYEPEPRKQIIKAFILGVLCVFPAVLLEGVFDIGSPLFGAVAVAPLVEESLKFFIFMIFFYHSKDFDEPMDGIIYASSIALGFATIENVFYVFSALQYGQVFEVASLRALLSIPGHFLFSALWGYAAATVKFKLRRSITLGAGLLTAILLHAGFNFTAILSGVGSIAFVVIFSIYAWVLFTKRLTVFRLDSKKRAEKRGTHHK